MAPRETALEVDARVIPLQEQMVGEYRPALLALTAAVALVLLIAGSNVAGLLLARGVTRRRELALRAALGAGRGRVARQLLTESVVLGVGGGVLGLAVAAAVLGAVPALVPGDVARLDEVAIDHVVLAFTLGLSVLVGLAFGAAPAFQWSGRGLVDTLNEGSPQATGGFRCCARTGPARRWRPPRPPSRSSCWSAPGCSCAASWGLVTLDRGYDPADVIAAETRNPDLATRSDQRTPEALAERPGGRTALLGGPARGSRPDDASPRRGCGRSVLRPAAHGRLPGHAGARRRSAGGE